MVNNLTSTYTVYPLSAAQGKALDDKITALKSNYNLVDCAVVPLPNSIANGNRSVNAIMQLMLLDIKALNPANYNATHMRLRTIGVPYGSGDDSIYSVEPIGNLGSRLYTSYSSVNSITATATGVSDSGNFYIESVLFGSTNVCDLLALPAGTVSHKINNKPANGTQAYVIVEFYNKVSS